MVDNTKEPMNSTKKTVMVSTLGLMADATKATGAKESSMAKGNTYYLTARSN